MIKWLKESQKLNKLKNKKKITLFLFFVFCTISFQSLKAQEIGVPNTDLIEKNQNIKKEEEKKSAAPTELELKSDTVDFDKIKDIIKNDKLDSEVLKLKNTVKQTVKIREEGVLKKYLFPSQEEFWAFFSEYWIVKNVGVLKWDFQKPDYGLESSFSEFLESRGIVEKKFKIILIDSPLIPHFVLPYNSQEYLFILSVPFIRTLDLSKIEISLLLYEDVLRLQKGYFLKYLDNSSAKEYFGKNFYNKKIDFNKIKELTKKYDSFILDKGYDFQQMFEVTREMDQQLRSDLKLWNTYVALLKKIDELAKNNLLYQKYNELYPSPELQLGWLLPKKPE